MSAETLRRAAALMRERAEAMLREGARDLWADMPAIDPDNNGWVVCEQRQPEVDWDTTVARLPYDYEGHGARHLASWHPVVALAVADLIDDLAEAVDIREALTPDEMPAWSPHALTVARAYLGGSA